MPETEEGTRPLIALDGKTLRGSFDHFHDRKAAQTLTAFASDAAIVLAHTEINAKSNEIPAAQQMIRELGLTGVLLTADAIHCQKKTFEAARDSGNHLLVQVKSNQPVLLETIREVCATGAALDRSETTDRKSHGRQEHRKVETFDISKQLGADWSGLIAIAIRVTRLTWHCDTKSGLCIIPKKSRSAHARPIYPLR